MRFAALLRPEKAIQSLFATLLRPCHSIGPLFATLLRSRHSIGMLFATLLRSRHSIGTLFATLLQPWRPIRTLFATLLRSRRSIGALFATLLRSHHSIGPLFATLLWSRYSIEALFAILLRSAAWRGARPGQPREGVPDRAPGPVLAPGPAEPGPGADRVGRPQLSATGDPGQEQSADSGGLLPSKGQQACPRRWRARQTRLAYETPRFTPNPQPKAPPALASNVDNKEERRLQAREGLLGASKSKPGEREASLPRSSTWGQ